jgi:AraC family transcriptional regulator
MTARLHFDVSVYTESNPFPQHRHDELQLSMILSGGVSETVGGRTETGRALSIVSKDSGVFHADQFHREGAKIARLSMRHSIMNDLVEPGRAITDWNWTHDPRVARPFLSLLRRAKSESLRSFGLTDPDVTDLLAAFSARPANGNAGAAPAWLREVMNELRGSWNAGTAVKDVARRAGVHPVYLARCVRRWYGTTVGDELRRLRLGASIAMLTSSQSTVSTVAHCGGYSDEPHFCRSTQNTLGLTPRRLRQLVARV